MGSGREGDVTHEILKLPPGLLDDAVLSAENDTHATEVLDLGGTDDEGVDVEATGGEDARDAGEDSRLVLDEAVESVTREGLEGRRRSYEDRNKGQFG